MFRPTAHIVPVYVLVADGRVAHLGHPVDFHHREMKREALIESTELRRRPGSFLYRDVQLALIYS